MSKYFHNHCDCNCHKPQYIVLFCGDDSNFVGNQTIFIELETDIDTTGCKAHLKYISKTFTWNAIPEDKRLELVFSAEETKAMPLGDWDAELWLEDAQGRRRTVSNQIRIRVTKSVGDAYWSEDPQSIKASIGNAFDYNNAYNKPTLNGVVIEGNKTSKDYHIKGGGGGTNDYNDLENKPSINNVTLEGNKTAKDLSLIGSEEYAEDKQATENAIYGVANKINTHETKYDNPHKVTAEQVGTYTTSEVDRKLAAKADEFTEWELRNNGEPITGDTRLIWTSAGWMFQIGNNDEWINGSNPKGDKDDIEITWGINEWTGTPNILTATRKRVLYTGDAVSSVNGKTGAVVLDAAAVGARPASWTPSASDVGARPDSWTPSAQEVGAFPAGGGEVGSTESAGVIRLAATYFNAPVLEFKQSFSDASTLDIPNSAMYEQTGEGPKASIKKGGKEVATEEQLTPISAQSAYPMSTVVDGALKDRTVNHATAGGTFTFPARTGTNARDFVLVIDALETAPTVTFPGSVTYVSEQDAADIWTAEAGKVNAWYFSEQTDGVFMVCHKAMGVVAQ